MTTKEKFDKWIAQSGLLGGGNLDVVVTRPLSEKVWQAALSSLEATPELVEIGFSATHERSLTTRRDISKALEAVFAAIKEGKA